VAVSVVDQQISHKLLKAWGTTGSEEAVDEGRSRTASRRIPARQVDNQKGEESRIEGSLKGYIWIMIRC